jgi:hypothetical protein
MVGVRYDLNQLAEVAQTSFDAWREDRVEEHGETWWHEDDVMVSGFDSTDRPFVVAASPEVLLALVEVARAAQAVNDESKGGYVASCDCAVCVRFREALSLFDARRFTPA